MSILTSFEEQQLPEVYLEYSQAELQALVQKAKEKLGDRVLLLAHHYQKSEVVEFADAVGDSLQLAQLAAKNKTAETIVFCGVHFMAETADMLTEDDQHVILPDRTAGCSMAYMANGYQVKKAWDTLNARYPDEIIPITYVNSSAEVKAFVGRHGGAIVTSGNAEKVLRWAFTQKPRVFFLPDQHLGRNTAHDMGIALSDMALWNPVREALVSEADSADTIILWDGWCSVHQQFTVDQIKALRAKDPAIQIVVHPECPQEVVAAADFAGSTKKILELVQNSPAGTHWGIGTDHNLVERMQQTLPQEISFINPYACACQTMNRIKLTHLAWVMNELAAGHVVEPITVDDQTTQASLKALDKMLALS